MSSPLIRLKELHDKWRTSELCLFTWRCCVRILPFLSVKREFKYWSDNSIKFCLHSIFYSLDLNAFYLSARPYLSEEALTAYDVTDKIIGATSDKAAKYVVACAHFTADAANSIFCAEVSRSDIKALPFEKALYDCAIIAADCAISVATDYFDMESIIKEEIDALCDGKLDNIKIDTKVYGDLWDNFQCDLKAIGLEFWATEYLKLFNNNFKYDQDEVKLRISIAKEWFATPKGTKSLQIKQPSKKKSPSAKHAKVPETDALTLSAIYAEITKIRADIENGFINIRKEVHKCKRCFWKSILVKVISSLIVRVIIYIIVGGTGIITLIIKLLPE